MSNFLYNGFVAAFQKFVILGFHWTKESFQHHSSDTSQSFLLPDFMHAVLSRAQVNEPAMESGQEAAASTLR